MCVSPVRVLAGLVLALGTLAGCGEGRGAAAAVGSERRDPPPRAERSAALAGVRASLEDGLGREALEGLAGTQGFESECLRARAQLLRGDAVAALAALERARLLDPGSAELISTEVEILANLRRIPSAQETLLAGLRRHGPRPELLRAQGVLELQREGHGAAALALLERARQADPGLPFLRWPLVQANLLAGRACLEQAPAQAEAHARAAQALAPGLDEAIELEAEALTGELRFEAAIARYEALEARGRDFGQTPAILHQRCATACLLARDHEGAVRHYLAARRRGMDDAALGFGREVLDEERRARLDRGIAQGEGGDWGAAEATFEAALALAPEDPEALNHLAVARFQRRDYRAAAETWQRLLAAPGVRAGELPDPVPLNEAKAWRLAGEPGEARRVLSALIDGDPEGPWSDPARELLLALEAEELAPR